MPVPATASLRRVRDAAPAPSFANAAAVGSTPVSTADRAASWLQPAFFLVFVVMRPHVLRAWMHVVGRRPCHPPARDAVGDAMMDARDDGDAALVYFDHAHLPERMIVIRRFRNASSPDIALQRLFRRRDRAGARA